jgi:hypothetical protein
MRLSRFGNSDPEMSDTDRPGCLDQGNRRQVPSGNHFAPFWRGNRAVEAAKGKHTPMTQTTSVWIDRRSFHFVGSSLRRERAFHFRFLRAGIES